MTPNTTGTIQPVKVFLRRKDADEGEPWQELAVADGRLTPFDEFKETETPTGHRFTGKISFTLRKPNRRKLLALLQECGIIRRPRFTYKTNVALINRRRYNGHRRPTK